MKKWFENGLHFECQGSGKCCLSRGEFGYVYMTLEDRRRMAKSLRMNTSLFTKTYCAKTEGVWHLKNPKGQLECIFLKENKCSVYTGRPTQCRTWPFWPETMNPKSWRKDVLNFCPGAGKGKLHSAKEIQKQMDMQTKSEESFGS